jgi:excisionase family DNA binding protein
MKEGAPPVPIRPAPGKIAPALRPASPLGAVWGAVRFLRSLKITRGIFHRTHVPVMSDVAPPPILTPREVAEAVRCTPKTIRAWCQDGHLEAVRVGGRWKIRWDAVFCEDGTLRPDLGPEPNY